ncbi:MAG: hypothetical protein J6T11_05755 [Bacteroidaceae bacterium]|nr:hypothetical protein [Bacteroidaceae bacterium]
MIKKQFQWVLVAILMCGLTVTTTTSCSKDDDSGQQGSGETEVLKGNWLAQLEHDDEYEADIVGRYNEYVLLNFGDDGVITQSVYMGNAGTSLEYWKRMLRHGIYIVNEAAGTITTQNLSREDATIKYSISSGNLNLSTTEKDVTPKTVTFHRPTKDELAMFSMYDSRMESDDYVGKWFMTNEHSGLFTHVLLDFNEDSGVTVTRYSVYEDNVTRTVYSRSVSTLDEEEGQKILFHDPADYSVTESYWWSVTGNQLKFVKPEYDEIYTIYHPLTKSDIKLMEELNKKCTD